jgi:hypothetical protein
MVITMHLGNRHVADLEVELTSDSLSQGGLTVSCRTVKEVTSPVWDTHLLVPVSLSLVVNDISDEIFADVLVEDDSVHCSGELVLALHPFLEPAPRMLLVDFKESVFLGLVVDDT